VLGWLRTLPGLILGIYIPGAAITAYELYHLEQYYKLRPSHAAGDIVVV
jgi:hypothetical protein